jgi:hypothetical protein
MKNELLENARNTKKTFDETLKQITNINSKNFGVFNGQYKQQEIFLKNYEIKRQL